MPTTGVILMTYGSPRDLDDVGAYITRIRGGRAPDEALAGRVSTSLRGHRLVAADRHHPAQASGLEGVLGADFRVAAGHALQRAVGDRGRLATWSGGERNNWSASSSLRNTPRRSWEATIRRFSAAANGVPARRVHAWHLNPAFVDVLASRIRVALAAYPADERMRLPVLQTAHSLPRRVVDREPDYVDQLQETARAIAIAAELPPEQWTFCYQSAGHTPEEWLKPDLLDVLPQLAAAGHRRAIVAPVQFLADHLETLYDIDVAGREQAVSAGMHTLIRVQAPNAVARLSRGAGKRGARRAGRVEPRHREASMGARLIRLGTRPSALARAQTEIIAASLREANPISSRSRSCRFRPAAIARRPPTNRAPIGAPASL